MKLNKLFASTFFLCLFGSITFSQTPRITPEAPVGKGVVVIKATRLIDGTGAAPINNAVVVVTDNTITAVGPAGSVRVPANAQMIDLGDVTLMPGFIDAHTHLVGRVLGDPAGDNAGVRDFESFAAIISVEHARSTLMAGFTSVRNVGASGKFDDMALRKAIDEGWTPGPRMMSAGHALGMRGGVEYKVPMGSRVLTPMFMHCNERDHTVAFGIGGPERRINHLMIEVDNLEQAIFWAEKMPGMTSGSVEIRPLGAE